jgi:hypothetical protein
MFICLVVGFHTNTSSVVISCEKLSTNILPLIPKLPDIV